METPKIANAPFESLRHGQWTIEGWSRAGIHSYWRVPELRVGFDFGAIPWDWSPTGNWFVSHAHLDHLVAMPAFLARRAMLKYPPPKVHVPHEVVDDVHAMLNAWRKLDRATLPVELIGMSPGDSIELSELHQVSAFATEHPVPSLGYVVWERRHKLRDELIGASNEQLRARKEQGETITVETRVPLLCYTGDTSPGGLETEAAIFQAQVLIIELSFARPDQSIDRIHQYGHLHLEDFVRCAGRFQNELIIAGHVTSRDDPQTVLQLAKQRLPSDLSQRMVIWGAGRVGE